jgi:hypothetical protein
MRVERKNSIVQRIRPIPTMTNILFRSLARRWRRPFLKERIRGLMRR